MPGPYKRGQPVNLVERFYLIDPLTHAKTLSDPTVVTFTLDQPDGTSVSYVFGVDGNVTKPMAGVYVCALGVLDPPGIYEYECVGTGAVEATSGVKTFEVLDDSVLPPPAESEFAMFGPCTSWIDGSDVSACCSAATGVDSWELDDEAAIASQLLYEISGRQFPGICERTVRPCRTRCGCFGTANQSQTWFWSGWTGGYGYVNGWWWNEGGDKCGCGTESYVKLAGYPVREIVNVKVDGVLLDPARYRLDQRTNLIRLPDADGSLQWWPACQNLALADDQPGTMSVTYKWGTPPPELGKRAAAQLACEIYSACTTGDCNLPTKVTKVVRMGVTIDRVASTAAMLRAGGTGLPLVDMFIASTNPQGMKRRPAIWSPDVQKFARKLGQ